MATANLGTITLWPAQLTKIPANWLPCDGRALQMAQYQALTALIYTTFGGSGNTFNLPDLRNNAPAGMRYIICVNGDFPENNI
ncbi:MAG: phage tail protein [Candidatus Competibacteraceae bacterium]